MFKKLFLVLTVALISHFAVFSATANATTTDKGSQYYDVKISPDGKHFAVVLDVEGKRTIAFLNSETMAYVGGAKLPRLSEVGDFFWANNERIIIKVFKKEPWREESIYYGELFAVNIDSSLGEMIYGYRALHDRKARGAGSKFKAKKRLDGSAEIISLLPNDERKILISSTLWAEGTHPSDTHWKDHGIRLAAVYELDIYNGQISNKRIAGSPVPYGTFLADAQGKISAVFGKREQEELYVRQNDDWQKVPVSTVGNKVHPLATNAQGSHLYTLDNVGQNQQALFELDLNSGQYTQVFSAENADLIDVEINKSGHGVYAARTDNKNPEYIVLNQDTIESQVFKNLLPVFPAQALRIISKNDDDSLFVVRVTTQENTMKFYIYNRSTNKLSAFG